MFSVHVRRTDYIDWIKDRYKGQEVGKEFFLQTIQDFLTEDPSCLFLVTSDDLDWCRENLKHPRLVFPDLPSSSVDPVVRDFILMTQTNHSIYDYGSFAFWGAVLAGGRTRLAGNYSRLSHSVLLSLNKHPIPDWTVVDVRSIVQ